MVQTVNLFKYFYDSNSAQLLFSWIWVQHNYNVMMSSIHSHGSDFNASLTSFCTTVAYNKRECTNAYHEIVLSTMM